MQQRAAGARPARPRVVILGGGFGGVGAARALKDADADVVLVDRNEYHTFQPLLYQLATGLLDASTVGHPLPDLFGDQENAAVHRAAVTGVDLERREVAFEAMPSLPYDYLVFGLGAEVNYFGVPGAAENAYPMYTLRDAIRLNEQVVRRWEAVDREPALADDGAINVVVVGGGATGVETVGALAELYQHDLRKDFPHADPDKARLTLVEAGPELFSMFKPDIRRYTKKALEKRGVEVMVGEVVESIEPTRVKLRSGTVLPAHTLVWGAGLQACGLVHSLGLPLERGHRVRVQADLSIPGHREAFAVGDVAWIGAEGDAPALPQLGSVALQSGEAAGENIARLLAGKATKPFAYHDKGSMATIGRGAAVVQMPGGRTMKGRAAQLAWGAVHLALLSTGEDRAKAVVDWTWAGFTHGRRGRIDIPDDDGAPREGAPVKARA